MPLSKHKAGDQHEIWQDVFDNVILPEIFQFLLLSGRQSQKPLRHWGPNRQEMADEEEKKACPF